MQAGLKNGGQRKAGARGRDLVPLTRRGSAGVAPGLCVKCRAARSRAGPGSVMSSSVNLGSGGSAGLGSETGAEGPSISAGGRGCGVSRASRCLQGLIHSAVAFWGQGRVCGSERKVRDLGPGCRWRLPCCPQQALPETYLGRVTSDRK